MDDKLIEALFDLVWRNYSPFKSDSAWKQFVKDWKREIKEHQASKEADTQICPHCFRSLSEHQYNAEYKCYTCTANKLHHS